MLLPRYTTIPRGQLIVCHLSVEDPRLSVDLHYLSERLQTVHG
jgi:hypothetical protein